jgi:hypothetical protein
MKRNLIAVGLLLLGAATPAAAETIQEDVRCILLSGMFIKAAKDEKGQQIARLTGAFYLGRIEGRADAKVLAEALRTESKAIDGKTAGTLMDACAAKLGHAQQTMNDLGRTLKPAK